MYIKWIFNSYLHYNAEISTEIHRLIEPIQNNSMLKIANKIYVMDNYRIKPDFNDVAKVKPSDESLSPMAFVNSGWCFRSISTVNQNRLILVNQLSQLVL